MFLNMVKDDDFQTNAKRDEHGYMTRRFIQAFISTLACASTLRKQAHAIYKDFFSCKNSKMSMENQRTIGPENAHLKPDLGVLSHNEMTLTLNTHTPLLTS